MSDLDVELKRLAEAAVDIAMIPKPEIRHKGGFWLQGELEHCFDTHLFSQEQRIEFMTVVKILLDVIFIDAVENPADMGKEFTVDANDFTKYVDAAQKATLDRL